MKEIEYNKNGFDPNATFINSSIDFNFHVSLYKNPLNNKYVLRGWKDNVEFLVENI